MQTKSIMIVGVGGQGSLLASRLLGSVLISRGYDVKVSEVHGMSQRGGSVVTYVKYGDKVYSPVIEKGEADVIISFEELEAARWISHLKPVISGVAEYPDKLIEKIENAGAKVIAVDALSLAQKAGNAKASNVVLMGKVASLLDFDESCWQNALKKLVPPKFLEVNKVAFELGKNA